MHDTAMIGMIDRALIVRTKLYRPRLSKDYLHRKMLLEKLDLGKSEPVSMVSVSASTLLMPTMESPKAFCFNLNGVVINRTRNANEGRGRT